MKFKNVSQILHPTQIISSLEQKQNDGTDSILPQTVSTNEV